eukprot:SM000220S07075  [mRNA]  locus=s220:96393:98940:- [translate_table: standard]
MWLTAPIRGSLLRRLDMMQRRPLVVKRPSTRTTRKRDEFVPLALGADFNAAGSLAQVICMRLSISLQWSMAHALHLRRGRTLAAASGFRQGDCLPPDSHSSLRLLSRAPSVALVHNCLICPPLRTVLPVMDLLRWPLRQRASASLLQRLAWRVITIRQSQAGEQPGFNAAGLLAQLFCMRLSVWLQCFQAFAVHLLAGLAVAAASGIATVILFLVHSWRAVRYVAELDKASLSTKLRTFLEADARTCTAAVGVLTVRAFLAHGSPTI